MIKLGIDVGGTNTDAILADEKQNIISEVKYPTSEDIYSGILGAVKAVLKLSGIDPQAITLAMLGTTQCTNAIVERKHLASFAVLRIGAPASEGIPPMCDWDEDLRKICVASTIIRGGYEYNGVEIAPFDETACRAFLNEIKGKAESLAVSCVFSTVRNDHELHAAEIAHEILGADFPVSISSEIGSMGLIERENATILNAALYRVAQSFTAGFSRSLAEEGITNARIYISQNDGTLMTMETARRYPILTIACGPTNSIRGAAWLSGKQEAIIVDVGGTTTDFGVVHNGFPRESGVAANIGGIRTNFRMPDVLSIGLGGGSIVRHHVDGSITVGPDSVGYRITEKALVFGGDTMTATDIAVRLGMADIGDASLVQSISQDFSRKALAVIRQLAEDALDSMKVARDDVDVVLVGGGSVILPKDLSGAAQVDRPEHFGTANAIGSAISKVSGTCEALIDYDHISRETAMAQSRQKAMDQAVAAGALQGTLEIVDVEEIPLQYHPGNTVRLKVRAVGDLK